MALVIPEPIIEVGNDVFDDRDLLGRRELGKRLSDLVERLDDPVVIALDGGWGSGKTFFLKFWTGSHQKLNEGSARVIYFDAFENDYLDDPLTSIVGVISDQPSQVSWNRKALKGVKTAAAKLARPVIRMGLAAVTAGLTEVAGVVADSVIVSGQKSLEQSVNDFWKREDGKRAAMADFRAGLRKLTAPDANGNPAQKIVLVVDELDRCRPTYALSVLETIKHFFSVPGVHFILGTNLDALANSVKASYGQSIDAERYLQKFIHIRMPLRMRYWENGFRGEAEIYWEWVSEQLGSNKNGYGEGIKEYLTLIQKVELPSLREIQRIGTLSLIVPKHTGRCMLDWYLICGLIVLQVVRPDLVELGRKGELTFAEVYRHLWQKSSPPPSDHSHAKILDAWKYALKEHLVISEEAERELVQGGVISNHRSTRVLKLIEIFLDVFQLQG